MELGVKWWSCAPKKFRKALKKGLKGRENPRSTWVAIRTRSPSRGLGSVSFPGRRAALWGMSPPSTMSSISAGVRMEGIQSPCNQPDGRAAREDDPPRPDFFPLPFAAAFFARSAAAVLSVPIALNEVLAERRCRGCGGEQGGSLRRKGEEERGRTVKSQNHCFI